MAPPPKRDECLPWGSLMVVSKEKLGIGPAEFWKLTFGEFWPLYNAKNAKSAKPMTSQDVKGLKERLKRGEFRRVGGKPGSRDKRS